MSARRPLPVRIVAGAWDFVDPQLKAGRIPFARTVLVMQAIAALVFLTWTGIKKEVQLPFVSDPYLVDVILPDAAGLEPSKEPAAGVAGTQQGRVVDMDIKDGQAVATLRLNGSMRGKIFNDATASLRPINVLQVLIVNIEPGNPETGALEGRGPIPPERTKGFVHIDGLTEVFDADTQAQVRILIDQAAIALTDREPQLRRILAEVAELTETATPLAEALEERRRLIRTLVDNLDTVFATLGRRGEQLARTIDAGSRTLAVTAEREAELTRTTRELAPTVLQAQVALAAGRRFAGSLTPALDAITPSIGLLQPAARKVRELIPEASDFLDQADILVRRGRRPVTLFEQGTRGLARRVQTELIPAVDAFTETVEALDKFKTGIAQTSDLWSAAFSVASNGGFYTQTYFGNLETSPEGLGLAPAAARSKPGEPSRMDLLLAGALERTCEENAFACLLRFGMPELPEEPVLTDGHDRGRGE